MNSGCLPFMGSTDEETLSNVLHSEIDFSGKFWWSFSPGTVNLLEWMLLRDPLKRATAEDILAHPRILKLKVENGSCENSPRSPFQLEENSNKTLHLALTHLKQSTVNNFEKIGRRRYSR